MQQVQTNPKRTVRSLYEQFNDTYSIDDMTKNKELRQLRNFLLDRMGMMRGKVELTPPNTMMGYYLKKHLNYAPQA